MIEGCKNTFDFDVEMVLISFVYEGISSKLFLRLPVSAKNTGIFFEGTLKSVAYLDYRVCVAVYGKGRNSQ